MAKLHRLHSAASSIAPPPPSFFSRRELQELLDLYSRGVACGEWRDYAIDQRGHAAIFSIYRHTHERALFSIAKRAQGGEYAVYSGPQHLKSAATLAEALTVLKRRRALHVVS